MTHEYTIATGGTVAASAGTAGTPPTAIAWAADTILAVGTDAEMRALSRGDSTFLDLAGATVTPSDAAAGPLGTGDRADLDLRTPDGTLVGRVIAGRFDHPDPLHGPLRSLRADGTSGTIP
ncbi:MAG: hypothetical protein U0869_16405 [Chloroflexota bacterium]